MLDSQDFLRVYKKPVPKLSISDTKLCNGPGKISLKDLTPRSFSRSWVVDGTNHSNTPDSITHKFVSEGWKSLLLIVKDSNGCTGVNQFQDTIIIYEDLVFDLEADVTSGCVPQEVSFNISKESNHEGFKSRYSWEIEISNNQKKKVRKKKPNPEFYSKPGSYDVNLLVSVSNGCEYKIKKKNLVRLGDNFPLNLPPRGDTVCKFEQVQIKQTNTIPEGELTWTIEGIDYHQDSSSNETLWVKGLESGYVDVLVDYSYNGYPSQFEAKDYIYVQEVDADFTSPNHYHCKVPHTVDLVNRTDTQGIKGLSYDWRIENSNGIVDSSNLVNPTFTFYNLSRSFDVQLIASDRLGCKDTQQRNDFIYQYTMKLLFDVVPKVACPGQLVQVLNETRPTTYKSGDSFKWIFTDLDDSTILDTSILRQPEIAYDSLGFYDIMVMGSNAEGCKDTLLLSDIVEEVNPTLDYEIRDEQICIVDTFFFSGKSLPERAKFNYDWAIKSIDSNTVDLLEGQEMSILPDHIGAYMIYYQHSISNGCLDEDSTLVHVNGVIAETILDTTYGCAPFSVNPATNVIRDLYEVSSTSKYDYNWSVSPETGVLISNSNSAKPTILFSEDGDYEIVLKITNAVGCSYITEPEVVRVGVRAGFVLDDETICLGDSLRLKDNSYNGVTRVSWSLSDNQGFDIVNGDGLNDVFEPISKFLKSADLSEVSDFSMSIFNRWGEMLYSSNDISASWDGTYRGNACTQGVYIYTIKVAGMDNSLVYESGTITLLR